MKRASFIVLIFGLAFVNSYVALASPAAATNFSGYEIFPGIIFSSTANGFDGCTIAPSDSGRATNGAAFTGWTDKANGWVSPRFSTGGIVSGSVNYIGAPGLGHTVCLTGGIWSWQRSQRIFFGSVTGGSVQWPNSGENNGCGTDIGVFIADLSVVNTQGTGEMVGCLNDETGLHIPKIWGRLTIN
jgi:hypothetical protein